MSNMCPDLLYCHPMDSYEHGELKRRADHLRHRNFQVWKREPCLQVSHQLQIESPCPWIFFRNQSDGKNPRAIDDKTRLVCHDLVPNIDASYTDMGRAIAF